MQTYWQVQEIIEKPGIVLATLQPVEWFKANPDYVAHANDVPAPDLDEFLEATPGEYGAESLESGLRITIDISDGPDLHPLDNVSMAMTVLTPVDA